MHKILIIYRVLFSLFCPIQKPPGAGIRKKENCRQLHGYSRPGGICAATAIAEVCVRSVVTSSEGEPHGRNIITRRKAKAITRITR